MRTDVTTERVVSQGIAQAWYSGVREGAKLMAASGVPIDVAMRVLLYPNSRRPTDWH